MLLYTAKSMDTSFTNAEIEEYCRDPESSGCDVDMLKALHAKAVLKNVEKRPKYRWSAEIDDAVFKTD